MVEDECWHGCLSVDTIYIDRLEGVKGEAL